MGRPLADFVQIVVLVHHKLPDEFLAQLALLLLIFLGKRNDQFLFDPCLLQTDEVLGQRHLVDLHEVAGPGLCSTADNADFL